MAKNITLDYDEKFDIWGIHIGEPCEAVGEELSEDVFTSFSGLLRKPLRALRLRNITDSRFNVV